MGYIRISEFSRVVKREMNKKGLSLRQMAAECGISPAYLSLVLNDKREPPQPEIINEMSRVLQLAPPILHLLAGYVPRHDRRWDGLFRRLKSMSDDEIDRLIEHIDSTQKGFL